MHNDESPSKLARSASKGVRRPLLALRASTSVFVLSRQGRRAGRRLAFAGADVFSTPLGVFLRRQRLQVGVGLGMNLLQKRNAPAAPRPGAAALRELARHLRLALPNEVDELAARDVKAVADFGVEVHDPFPFF